MGILLWIIFGALAGWIASILAGKDGSIGWFGNIVVGIVGSFIGNFILMLLTGDKTYGFTLGHFVVSVLGAMALLWAVSALSRPKNRL